MHPVNRFHRSLLKAPVHRWGLCFCAGSVYGPGTVQERDYLSRQAEHRPASSLPHIGVAFGSPRFPGATMTDAEFSKAAEKLSIIALDMFDSHKDAVDGLCEAVAIVAAKGGFTVEGADDMISHALHEYTAPRH